MIIIFIFVPGTLQSSKTSSHVFEPLMPSLSNLGDVLKPGKSFYLEIKF